MCNAAGQAPDRIHFLCLHKLGFEPQTLGKVPPIGNEMRDMALAIAHGADALFHVVQFAILLRLTRIPRKTLPARMVFQSSW